MIIFARRPFRVCAGLLLPIALVLPLCGCGANGLEGKIQDHILDCFNKTHWEDVLESKDVAASIAQSPAMPDDNENGYSYRGVVTITADQENSHTQEWAPAKVTYDVAVKDGDLVFVDDDYGCSGIDNVDQ